MTCQFKCANACDHPPANRSDNPYFGDVVASALSRRNLLAGAGAVLVAGAAGSGSATAYAGQADAATGDTPDPAGRGWPGRPGRQISDLRWTSVEGNTADAVTIPEGFEQHVLVRWGDPVIPGAPEFDFENQTAEAQEQQFGYNNDFLAVLPLSRNRALLVANHEYTTESLMFRDWTEPANATDEQLRIGLAGHGLSVVEIERDRRIKGKWKLRTNGRRKFNRRITVNTEMRLTGPAAGDPLLQTEADPQGTTSFGTWNNCAGGVTPWGTTLHGEENWHGYFDLSSEAPADYLEGYERYGLPTDAGTVARNWAKVDERFDLGKHPNEAHRVGWIVELDPYDPESTPRKRTMLGRFKHEGATISIARNGQVVAYSGDDEVFEYIYKFVSRDRYDPRDREHALTLLDHGTLYVAKFEGEPPDDSGEHLGTGEWLPLCSDQESFVEGMSVAEVLVHTRIAADKVGATKMDRPEDVEPNPVTGRVYAALTNNGDRTPSGPDGPNPPNPRPNNKHGHVLEWEENSKDQTDTKIKWRLILVCGDPNDPSTYYGGYDKSQVSPISTPDNVMFDRPGNLWIATDGYGLGSNDGLFAVPTEGRERGHSKRFLTVPVGAETCGPLITEDQRTIMVAVQHPGEGDGATPDDPISHWPDGGDSQPRPSVVCVWRSDRHDH